MTINRILTVMVCLLMTISFSCGYYSFRATNLPPELHTVYVPIFESTLSAEELAIDIKEDVTNEVQAQFQQLTRLTLADEADADAVFLGKLIRYTREIDEYDENENPTRYRISLSVAGEFRNLVNDEVIWQQASFQSYDYFEVDEGQTDLGESAALTGLIEKLARNLVTQATENW